MRHGFWGTKAALVLRALAKYGTLSTNSIMTILNDSGDRRSFRKLMNRLADAGLVVRLSFGFSGTPASYFQLCQGAGALKIASDLTGISPQELDQKRLRYTHFAHEDICSMIQFAFENEVPGVVTIRDWEIARRNVPEIVIPQALRQAKFMPDLIVALPVQYPDTLNNPSSFRWIAVEIERSRKKHLRVYSKLKTYATECGFDGLLYMIPEEVLLENYLNHFDAEVAPKALRIRSFKDAYFARSLLPRDRPQLASVSVDCGKRHLSLKHWIDFIASTSLLDRAEKWEQVGPLRGHTHPSSALERIAL